MKNNILTITKLQIFGFLVFVLADFVNVFLDNGILLPITFRVIPFILAIAYLALEESKLRAEQPKLINHIGFLIIWFCELVLLFYLSMILPLIIEVILKLLSISPETEKFEHITSFLDTFKIIYYCICLINTPIIVLFCDLFVFVSNIFTNTSRSE